MPACSGSGGAIRRALSFDAVGYISCHRDRADHLIFVACDDREGHLDVDPASALVYRAGQRRAAFELRLAVRDRSVEATPVRGSQMLGNDQVEILAERLLRRVAKQSGGRAGPQDDLAGTVCIDHGIRGLVENLFSNLESEFHRSQIRTQRPQAQDSSEHRGHTRSAASASWRALSSISNS